jgi:magnesium-protoporphyrin IX monomethyl ester (oxidative) cyclase
VAAARAAGGLKTWLGQLRWGASGLAHFVKLYCLPVKRHDLPAQIRVAPAW